MRKRETETKTDRQKKTDRLRERGTEMTRKKK